MIGLSLRYEQQCGVCRQPLGSQPDAAVEFALFGHVAFAQCPCCRQEVHDHHDRNYRARARRWIARREKR